MGGLSLAISVADAGWQPDPVSWTYRIRNTGTVPLAIASLDDDRLGSIPCAATLQPGQKLDCEQPGVAGLGQYVKIATVWASHDAGTVSDTDPSHY